MIKKATINDLQVLSKLAIQMWCDNSRECLEEEFKNYINSKNTVFFIKYFNETPVGFAQCSLRKDYVEGTESSPVGYLEGIFVEEKYRKEGIAKELLLECEAWSKSLGCSEFASDCELTNITSLKFHLSLGFTEVNRIICFKKDL